MDIWSHVRTFFADDRLDANLIGFYGVIVVTFIVSMVMRRLMTRGGARLVGWTGVHWLEAAGDEAMRHMRSLLFWLTVCFMSATVVFGIVYHLVGRDLRHDLGDWYHHFTVEQLVRYGLTLATLLAVMVTTRFAIWTVRRVRPALQHQADACIGKVGNRDALCSWFALLERFSLVVVRLGGLWMAGHVIGFGQWSNSLVGFILRMLTIVVAARLLTLACRTLSHTAADMGDRQFAAGHLHRYWERMSRLFPFGERCFEAAVYVSVASLCVSELHFIAMIADFGPRIVQCIGILFGTRVLIELSQVLLNEAFGLYDPAHILDAKGRTLVPLLQSVCQYVLYFGSVVVMLGVLGVDTRPILAGAGILGLAVGLGAQNLVTDVVSGFFILFENQYLVGDYVKVGDAVGTVEAVGIRLTQIRDGHGKLWIIPNGQIKGVTSYSKGYINAVVDLKVPAGSDLEHVFRAMADAGRRLRKAHKEVLAETEVQGVVELGTSDMTVRAVTKVEPGTHGAMQSEYRRFLKQVLDQKEEVTRPRLAA
ncbi:MAG: mechanosensitive ion channel family protein [Gemmataceae bacterium]|nr:mechanosensitive ion channel family protein [Gemmataceae bacterium]